MAAPKEYMIVIRDLNSAQATNIKHLLECHKWSGVKICTNMKFHEYKRREAEFQLSKEYDFDVLEKCAICSMPKLDSIHQLNVVI